MAAYTLTLSISSESPLEMASTVEALGKSLSALNSADGGTVIAMPGHGTELAKEWYASHASAFLDELTPDALRAVLFVADNAPTVPIDTLSSELELGKGPALAGKLASIGWAVRRLSSPPPFRRVRDRYEMDPGVATAIRSARPQPIRRPSIIRPASARPERKAVARRSGAGGRRVASRP